MANPFTPYTGKSLPIYAVNQPQNQRIMRRPQHTFQVETRPFLITPFMLAPVLPGETLENMVFQARVVTDPIKHPLIGWWQEYYFFYVRHRDMADSDLLQSIMLDPSTSLSSLAAGASNTHHYTYQGGIPWAAMCEEPVVKSYFRTPDEVAAGTWDDYTVDNLHVASINRESWLDSIIDATVMPDGGDLPDDADNATIAEVDRLNLMYQALRDASLTDMDYEDWLKTYGVVLPAREQPGKPELIRYSKNWQYPSNTIDPADGSPSSAVSWAVADRADKQRFFKEPGFIYGVCVTRPKVYLSKQVGAASGMLDNAFTWLPAVMQQELGISLKEFAADTGPLFGNTTNGFWLDVRDLYIYGDQWVNFALTETDNGLVALPTPALQHRYPASSDLDALFSAASPANKVRMDGVVNLGIRGRQRDMT